MTECDANFIEHFAAFAKYRLDEGGGEGTTSNLSMTLLSSLNNFQWLWPEKSENIRKSVANSCTDLCVNIWISSQEAKSGALKKTSRYRSRSLSASSTDSYSSGELTHWTLAGRSTSETSWINRTQPRIRAVQRTTISLRVKKCSGIPAEDLTFVFAASTSMDLEGARLKLPSKVCIH